MSSNLKKVSNVERRTWDKEAYEARAKARTDAAAAAASSSLDLPRRSAAVSSSAEDGDDGVGNNKRPILPLTDQEQSEKEEFVPAVPGAAGPERSKRSYLKARKNRVDLESKVGTSEIVSPDAVAVTGGSAAPSSEAVKITDGVTKSSTGVGWHCKVCDCYLKDSLTYLDHINGRKHQRYLGYSMRVEKVSARDVSVKLAELAEAKKKADGMMGGGRNVGGGKRSSNAGNDGGEPNVFEEMVRKKDEEALRRKAERARKREERRRREREEEEEEEGVGGGVDPDIAAMMGFGGFGGGNKNR